MNNAYNKSTELEKISLGAEEVRERFVGNMETKMSLQKLEEWIKKERGQHGQVQEPSGQIDWPDEKRTDFMTREGRTGGWHTIFLEI